jgi:hypothetical protein
MKLFTLDYTCGFKIRRFNECGVVHVDGKPSIEVSCMDTSYYQSYDTRCTYLGHSISIVTLDSFHRLTPSNS